MSGQLQNGEQQFFDNNGKPLNGGTIDFYVPNTTTRKTTWQDQALTIQNTNPIILDAGGKAIIWGSGSYRQVLKDKNNNLIWDQVVADPIFSLSGPTGASQVGANDGVGGSLFTTVAGFISTIKSSIGSSIIGFIQAGIGAIVRSVQDKLRESVSVKDFGAMGDGVTDDSPAIAKALAASQRIYFPPGQYRITSPIMWTNQWLEGAVDNGVLSLSNIQTMILADGTFPAFQYKHPNGFNSHGGCIRNFNILFADGLQPAVDARPNAIGFKCDGTAGYPAFHTIENITVRGGQWAVFDSSGSWMGTYRHVHSDLNVAGFYKQNGTTHLFENCYHRSGKAGFHFTQCLGVVLNGCAVDLCITDTNGYYPVFVENSNVVLNGGDFEGINLTGSFREAILVNGTNGYLELNGVRILDSQITADNEMYFIHAMGGAKVVANGVSFGPTTYVGSGGLFTYFSSTGSAHVQLSQCVLPALLGGVPATTYSGLATTGSLDYEGTTAAYPWRGYSRMKESGIRFSATLALPTIAANSFQTVTYDLIGTIIGDYAQASLATAINGVIANAWVNSNDQVSINFYNLTASPITLPSTTVRIVVTQQ